MNNHLFPFLIIFSSLLDLYLLLATSKLQESSQLRLGQGLEASLPSQSTQTKHLLPRISLHKFPIHNSKHIRLTNKLIFLLPHISHNKRNNCPKNNTDNISGP